MSEEETFEKPRKRDKLLEWIVYVGAILAVAFTGYILLWFGSFVHYTFEPQKPIPEDCMPYAYNKYYLDCFCQAMLGSTNETGRLVWFGGRKAVVGECNGAVKINFLIDDFCNTVLHPKSNTRSWNTRYYKWCVLKQKP